VSEPFLIGLVGARGYVGREILRLIAGHPEMMLAYAVSREWAGKKVCEIAPEETDECIFEALNPEAAAKRKADAVILALPDGAAGVYLGALETYAPGRIIIDLSADKRFDDDWAYGLPEHHREKLHHAKRIANPGCYATAMQIALGPLVPHLGGVPAVFGVSGFSGAGTTPSPRNDPQALAENLIPYKLVGHKHELEATRHLGVPVRFMPHVHPAFRGLLVTAHVPLGTKMTIDQVKGLFVDAYGKEPLVAIQESAPELKQGANISGVVIGGIDVSTDGMSAIVVVAEDNLLKGAAVQALQNLNLALGLREHTGLSL